MNVCVQTFTEVHSKVYVPHYFPPLYRCDVQGDRVHTRTASDLRGDSTHITHKRCRKSVCHAALLSAAGCHVRRAQTQTHPEQEAPVKQMAPESEATAV